MCTINIHISIYYQRNSTLVIPAIKSLILNYNTSISSFDNVLSRLL